jgi:hypothetical protein
MCTLALDTQPFLDSIKSTSATKILRSMKDTAWRAPSLPSTDTESKAPSTVDVRPSHKHRKPDSDSDGGSGNGRTDGRSHPKRAKTEGGNVREDAEDKSGHSGAHGGGKGKAKACAGGSGEDDDNDLESGGSATFSEGRMARQRKSGRWSLQGGLLEAHTVPSSAMTPTEGSFHEIEKWRSSIAV